MTTSWHNFFFASFDAGGLVSVDKPPLALWVQAASAKLFGFSSLSLLLPEALAGVAAVGILYLLVARFFGRVAGVVAALALAVSPVSVAVNRDNNPDALFALLLVAAAYAGARAAQSGRLRWLLASAVAVGLAFNTKMLAALIVLPALAAAYAFFAPLPWRGRILRLLAAGGVLTVVSGAWVAAVELTPAGSRPYVGSTSDSSALSLVLGYNGLGRITGQEGGTSFGGGGPGGGAFSGTPGLFRLLNDVLGDQGAWLFPLALLGGLSAVVAALRFGLRRRAELSTLVVAGGWFVVAAGVFSYAGGIIHTYYVSALAPATAALVGIGVVALWRDVVRGCAWVALPVAAIVGTAWLEVALLQRTGYLPWLQTVVVFTAVVGALGVLAVALDRTALGPKVRLLAACAIAVAVVGALAPPAGWSASTSKSAVNGVFPGAGPNFVSGSARGFGAGLGPSARPGGGSASTDIDSALAYAKAHGATQRFQLVVSSEQSAASYVIAGERVAAMGGFTGRETVLTQSYLRTLVADGGARYFLVGGSGGGPGGFSSSANAGADAIAAMCTEVPSTAWGGSSGTLYDCAGS